MAGSLFGGPLGIPQQPQQGGGIFGNMAQPAGWGGIFAALKDAADTARGVGKADNFANFQAQNQQNDFRQKLMQGLNSQDPAERQQAYTAYTMLGGDPKPFQQQQAATALPKLLQSMQPKQENVASLSLPNGQSTPAFDYQTPGLGLTDALSQSNSPELQAQYAPQVITDMLQRQDKQVRPATAEEKTAAGLDPKTPAQINAYGQLSPISDPNQITAYQSKELAHQDATFAETKRHNRADEANAAPGDVDPQTVSYWAQSVAAGAPLPALGMGKQAALYRQAILKGAAQINNGQGLSGVDQNVNSATTKANTGALAKQTALRTATEGFENTMLQNMNVVREAMKKGAGTTGVPILNRYQQYLKGEYGGDPDVIALQNAIDTVADENAKIRSGTLGNTPATDAMRNNIKAGLNGSMTPDQIEKAFQVMERDAGNRSRSLRAQEAAIKGGLRGKNDLPQIPGIREPQALGPNASAPQPLPQLPPKAIGPKIRVFNPATGRLE